VVVVSSSLKGPARTTRAWTALLALAASACGDAAEMPAPAKTGLGVEDRMQWPSPLLAAARGDAQREALCAREGDDLVRELFCGDAFPVGGFTSLVQLQTALGIDADRIGGFTGLALSAHSTGLATRSVSAINPRLIAIRLEEKASDIVASELLAVSYVRGEQSVELAVRDRQDSELRFYFVAYRQACNDAPHGCTPGDVLTPATESDWTESSLYDETDLADTMLDCRQCHQPDGPGSAKLLRMQEFSTPWTHWLFKSSRGGRALLADYSAAHADEVFGGMPEDRLQGSHPGNIAMTVSLSNPPIPQPNEFSSEAIEAEVMLTAKNQPEDNSLPGDSPTWRKTYEAAKQGQTIPVPYLDVKVTDAAKLSAMTEAYAAFVRGELDASALPDIRDVYPDDPRLLAEMGFTTEPDLAAAQVLTQACAQCHNDRLDQTVSRSRFNVDLGRLARAEKAAAIARLQLPATDVHAMPPRRVRTLSDQARTRLIELLKR
jgi:hypothetical protein